VDLYSRCADQLVESEELKNVLFLGCGPKPKSLEMLTQRGYEVVGVEPVPSFVRSAREYLGAPDRVLEGAAEEIPLASGSQDMVICESVLEHVESPTKSLDEIFRVLAPGGVACIITSNRHRVSLKGHNGEFNVRYYNWLPDVVKESFVFKHLHYDPSLANYTQRPAVHWYSYADLCKLGRQAGFYKFYSILDLLEKKDPLIAKNRLRVLLLDKLNLLDKLKYNPWLRALALTQSGGFVVMNKRR
jgi:ubiquinone/menaquinone biosynthesis C-methylase UbiE